LTKVLTKRKFNQIKLPLKSYGTSIYEHITSQIPKQKRFTACFLCKPLSSLVRPARFERATYGFVGEFLVQLYQQLIALSTG
jgi:hypothetical protein